jgi:hypothetical protein
VSYRLTSCINGNSTLTELTLSFLAKRDQTELAYDAPVELNLSLSLSLSHTHTHTHTHSGLHNLLFNMKKFPRVLNNFIIT